MIVWDIGIRPVLNLFSDNEGEKKTRENISLYKEMIFRSMYRLILYLSKIPDERGEYIYMSNFFKAETQLHQGYCWCNFWQRKPKNKWIKSNYTVLNRKRKKSNKCQCKPWIVFHVLIWYHIFKMDLLLRTTTNISILVANHSVGILVCFFFCLTWA